MDNMFDNLYAHGYPAKTAWVLATRLSRRMFEDMAATRQGVKGSLGQTQFMRPSVLWRILKTHTIMKEYLDHDFKNHPSMASEFVRFLVTNPRDAGMDELKSINEDLKKKIFEQKKEIIEAQKAATTASNKVVALTTSLKTLEARIKSWKSKA